MQAHPSIPLQELGVVLAALKADHAATQTTEMDIHRANGPQLLKDLMPEDPEMVNHEIQETLMPSVQICTPRAYGQT